MRLIWSDGAQADLLSIFGYLAERDPSAAQRVMDEIARAARRLVVFPQLGRRSDRSAVRLLQVPGRPYLLPYRVYEDDVEILAVFDERMERPDEWQ